MNNSPLISIILTTFNRAHLIIETLESIQNQTYQNWICYIIDDNSSDNTKCVVEEFIKNDKRFSFFQKRNLYVKGLSASRNMGLDLIEINKLNPKYIQFFDDDDLMHFQKFEIQMNEFLKSENIDLVIFPTKNFINSQNIDINYFYTDYNSKFINNIGEEFILAKTIFTVQVPLIKYEYISNYRFNEHLFYAEEWEFFLKLFFIKNTIVSYINIPLYFHRKHELSITSNLYGINNKLIKSKSKSLAFESVYKNIKYSKLFNGKVFSKFITYAIYNSNNSELLDLILYDLKNNLILNKFKCISLIIILKITFLPKSIYIRIIHRISRL